MEYAYELVDTQQVNSVLKRYADDGWRVQSLSRNRNASVVDILFYRYTDER